MSIRRSPTTKALGGSLEGEIDGAYEMLANLSAGIGPRPKDIVKYSNWFQLILKRLENFFSKDLPRSPSGGQLRLGEARTMTHYGALALRAHYDEVKTKFESKHDAELSMKDIQPLKAYNWLPNDNESAEVRKWIGILGSRTGSDGADLRSIADDNTQSGAIVVAGDRAPGASSSSSTAPTSASAKNPRPKSASSRTRRAI